MKVLVTGSGGFIGGALVGRLRESGIEQIYGVSRKPGLDVPGVEHWSIDLADERCVPALCNFVEKVDPDWIIHLAGSRGPKAASLWGANVSAAAHLLEAVRKCQSGARVAISGSAAEYGAGAESGEAIGEANACRPSNEYGISKYCQTLYALDFGRRHGISVNVLRLFNVVGKGMPDTLFCGAVLKRAVRSLRDGSKIIEVGNLHSKRDYVTVTDVAEAFVGVCRSHCEGEIFNICSGVPVASDTLLQTMLSMFPETIRFHVNAGLATRPEVSSIHGSWTKASDMFGFRPCTLLSDALHDAYLEAMAEETV